MKKFKIFLIILLSIPSFAFAIDIEFTIHPHSPNYDCDRIYPNKGRQKYIEKEMDNETNFSKLLKQGSLSLVKCDFQADRKYYPCYQTYKLEFKDKNSLCDYVRQMDCCPRYPWSVGADLALYEAIIKYAADSGDQCLYRALLIKKPKYFDEELNRSFFLRLRKNLKAFFISFSKMSEEEKRTVVRKLYDRTASIDSQLIEIKSPEIKGESLLIDSATDFNRLLKEPFTGNVPVYQEDEYPISIDMKSTTHNFKYRKMPWYSVIFKNDDTNEVLIMEKGVNYGNLHEYHFHFHNDLPDELTDCGAPYLEKPEIVTEIKKSKNIDRKYFTSKRGLYLGSTKKEAIKIYGKPKSIIEKNDIEILSWDEWRDGRKDTDPQNRLEMIEYENLL